MINITDNIPANNISALQEKGRYTASPASTTTMIGETRLVR